MMISYKYFKIADIQFQLEAEMPIAVSERFNAFEVNSLQPDITIHLAWEKESDISDFNIIHNGENYTIFQKGNIFLKCQYSNNSKTNLTWKMYEDRRNPTVYKVYICKNWAGGLRAINPLFFFEMSSLLIRQNAIILHSSVISYNGKGIVFTAPSGTGKSTQANLWEKYRSAEILNGDRTIIRKQSMYQAWGSPYAGSSGIYKNKSAKLAAIVVLRQAAENTICRLTLKEAYLYLLSELSISRWDRGCIEKQSTWLLQLVQDIPVYRLDCLPNEGAVQLLEKELRGL